MVSKNYVEKNTRLHQGASALAVTNPRSLALSNAVTPSDIARGQAYNSKAAVAFSHTDLEAFMPGIRQPS